MPVALALVVGFALLALGLSGQLVASISAQLNLGPPPPWLLLTCLMLYAVLLAVPFMPSAELGLLLLIVLGGKIAAPVYLATLLGLTLAYGVGRLVPSATLQACAERLGAARLARLIAAPDLDAGSSPLHRPGFPSAIRKTLSSVSRHRGVALIVLLNMPGNTIVGGGGGIALTSGLSRAFPFPAFIGLAAIAVAPVPGAFLIWDIIHPLRGGSV